eukprot:GHVP01021833.1.p1 GENE.GHVP01021833.1~~GHVP01021833.1.p1  ORF type:complete len:375 (+),score=36.69 GHVP01021833.1:114-1238(+)
MFRQRSNVQEQQEQMPVMPSCNYYSPYPPSNGPSPGSGPPSSLPPFAFPNSVFQMQAPKTSHRYLLPMRDIGTVEVHYFSLGKFVGRGGHIRLYLLLKCIKHSTVDIPVDEHWDEKKDSQYRNPSTNPDGTLPVVVHNDRYMSETHASLRYIAKKIGEYGANHQADYMADMVVDKLSYWRDEVQEAIQQCLQKQIPKRYHEARGHFFTTHEMILQQNGVLGYLSDSPTWCDAVLAAILWDDMKLMEDYPEMKNYLDECPKIRALYEKFLSEPLVEEWLDPSKGESGMENVEQNKEFSNEEMTSFYQQFQKQVMNNFQWPGMYYPQMSMNMSPSTTPHPPPVQPQYTRSNVQYSSPQTVMPVDYSMFYGHRPNFL